MGCFTPDTVQAGTDGDSWVNRELAGISRQMYQDYISRFRPLEIEAVQENLDPNVIRQRVSEAEGDAGMAWDAARGISTRALSDFGMHLSGDQQQTRDRLFAQNRSAGIASTVNNVRRGEADRQLLRGDQLMATGRGIEGTALSGYSHAAGLEQGRNQANAAAHNQANAMEAQNNAGMASTAAMMAAMAFFSDEELKHRIVDVPEGKALRDVQKIDVKTYNYRPETGLPQERKVGGMAGDMPDYVKRGDGTIDVQNSIGMLTKAVQDLDRKVARALRA